MKKYLYKKAGESTATPRTLAAVRMPRDLVTALDVTQLEAEGQVEATRLYEEWLEEVYKPYSRLESEFRKNNLKSWEEFGRERGLDTPPMVKNFKVAGLTPV